MRHVHVPADDHGLLRVQAEKIASKSVLPGHAVVQALQPVLGVGRVDADQEKAGVFQRNGPPLPVVFLQAQAEADGQGLMLCKNGGAGVALFLRVVPVLQIARRFQRELAGLQLCLLYAEKIRVEGLELLRKALLDRGPQAVDVPGDELHPPSPLSFFANAASDSALPLASARLALRSRSGTPSAPVFVEPVFTAAR